MHGNKGKPKTPEHNEKNRLAHLGKPAWNKGLLGFGKGHKPSNTKPNSGSFKKYWTGEQNRSWKGGHDKYWKKQAKIRDDYVCQMCGLREPDIMVTDHIRPKAIRPDLARSIDNLMTLCPNCHARKTKIDFQTINKFKKDKNGEQQ